MQDVLFHLIPREPRTLPLVPLGRANEKPRGNSFSRGRGDAKHAPSEMKGVTTKTSLNPIFRPLTAPSLVKILQALTTITYYCNCQIMIFSQSYPGYLEPTRQEELLASFQTSNPLFEGLVAPPDLPELLLGRVLQYVVYILAEGVHP